MINTSKASTEGEKQFYDIERAIAGSDSKYKVITGDFNAKIGTKTKAEDLKSMGAFRIRERNERGDRLIKFAEEHKLIIENPDPRNNDENTGSNRQPQG